MKLRKAKEEDKEFLLKLRYDTMEQHLLNAGYEVNDKEMLKRIEYKWDYANIIEFEGDDIGLLKVDKSGEVWELVQIQIKKSHRNRGLGRNILNQLIKEANSFGKSIELEALVGNRINKLYKSLGFEEVEVGNSSIKMILKKKV